jgi:DNA-binding CsgD family transcriptional regulator
MWNAYLATWEAIYEVFGRGDRDGAWRILEKRRIELPTFARYLSAVGAGLQLLTERVPDPESLAALATGSQSGSAETAETVHNVHIAALLAAGRTTDAMTALRTCTTPTVPYCAENYRIAVGLAKVLHGDLDDGVEWALQAMAEAENGFNLGEIHGHAYVAALGLTFAGRLDDLNDFLGPTLTLQGTTFLHEHFQAGVLSLAALLALWRGHPKMFFPLTAQAEAIGRYHGPFPAMLHGVTPILETTYEPVEAGKRLWEGVRERLENGYLTAGIALAITAIEVTPSAADADLVSKHALESQSPLLAALGRYITATGSGDPQTLANCATDLWARGLRVHAVKAAVTRSIALRERGEIEASIEQAEAAWVQSQETGRRSHGLFYRLGKALGLGPREREIALMLVQGGATQDIADSLGISTRTVENYLVGVYRKVGVEGRDALAQAVSTWAVLA